ncbi:hypothetical protein ACEWY4_015234 [Coilia grayii]|uniref:G-protein coupled receptors family 1 profile domain-containing protein n=1 Tax=Coilia grayii TaxID=363190 RepID=A0ABD1JPH7_9TELE
MNGSFVNDSHPDSIAHATQGIYTTAYSIYFLLGLPVNIYILRQIVIETTMTSEFFTLNLVLCEIIFCLKSPLLLLHFYVIPSTLGDVLEFFDGFNGMGRPLFQTCICAERYLAVLHPVLFLKYKPLRYRLSSSGVGWLIVLGCCVASMLVRNTMFYFYMSLYMILISLKLLCCLVIRRALRNPAPGEGRADREGASRAKVRAFKVITVIMVSTVVNYICLLLLLPLEHILSKPHFELSIAVCLSVSIFTGLTQPSLYLHRTGKLSCLKGS